MSESARRVLITPDPKHPDWYRATGRDLLAHTHRIGSVETNRGGGISYHKDFAEEVRAALLAAGYRITDAQPRTDPATPAPARGHTNFNHRVYVSDQDNLTILPNDTPGGHWTDESASCPRCNPDHQAAAAEHRARMIAQTRADLARAGTMPDPPEQDYRCPDCGRPSGPAHDTRFARRCTACATYRRAVIAANPLRPRLAPPAGTTPTD